MQGFPLQNQPQSIDSKYIFMIGARRQFSSWIGSYADQGAGVDRMKTFLRDVVPRYKGNDVKNAILEDFSRSRHAMKTAFAVRNDITGAVMSNNLSQEVVPVVKAIDQAVQEWLRQALSLDTLQHRRITFDHSSGYTLERVARGESVHRVRSLSELKRRLHDGKRCFGFFHPSLEAEPLVFVHIGLTTELAGSLG